jgi:hypothetical protein
MEGMESRIADGIAVRACVFFVYGRDGRGREADQRGGRGERKEWGEKAMNPGFYMHVRT